MYQKYLLLIIIYDLTIDYISNFWLSCHCVQAGGSNVRPKFEAFEVSINEDGKGPPPRRLSVSYCYRILSVCLYRLKLTNGIYCIALQKLDSVPKLTTEMLAEKQRQVEERKQQVSKPVYSPHPYILTLHLNATNYVLLGGYIQCNCSVL